MFPTFARLAGVDLAPAWRLEGRDIGPLLAGEAIPAAAPTLYWNTGRQAAVLDGDWKLIVTRRGPGSVELYNLADDPAEARNLAKEKPEQVEALRGSWPSRSDSIGEPWHASPHDDGKLAEIGMFDARHLQAMNAVRLAARKRGIRMPGPSRFSG